MATWPALAAEYAATVSPLAKLMASKIVKRSWRITQTGHALRLRARLASTPDEIAATTAALTAYLADVARYEHEGSEVAVPDVIGVGGRRAAARRPAGARRATPRLARLSSGSPRPNACGPSPNNSIQRR